MDKDNVLRKAIEIYGENAQLWMVIEEMSELEKEICKRIRGKDNGFEIADEMADVYIMMEQLRIICNVPVNLIRHRMRYKINRLQKRMDENGRR